MDEQRVAAYDQLIEKLLQSSPEEHPQILNAHSDLLNPRLLPRITVYAKYFNDNGNQKVSNFLTKVGLGLGALFGSASQPTEIRKETADILLKCGIQQLNIGVAHLW